MVLDLDLNVPPPVENVFLMSNLDEALDLGLSLRPPTVEMQQDDDEVIICSPRSFAEAREKKSRRNMEFVEVLDERESLTDRSARQSSSGNRRRRATWTEMAKTDNLFINLERHESTMNIPKGPKQPQATFKCPVCMSSLVEETSTKCGHIFCKNCIISAIQAQSKCPTCRRKLKAKDTFRIYLPTTE
jgi:hypothetical protein